MKNKEFWEERYSTGNTGWDLGSISPPLKTYIDQLEDKELKILIPGAGNSYEAEYLFQHGFKNVFIIDIAKQPLYEFKNRIPEFPSENVVIGDFFKLKKKFDLILEQTFFCAIPTSLRTSYAEKASELLHKNGKIAGLLFNTHFAKEGPPFGGNKEEYLMYFSPYFEILKLEEAYNSAPPRQGNELFFNFRKK